MNSTTLIPNTPTTIGSWALLIAKAIESYGLSPVELFEQAKIDLESIQQNPDVRLPVNQMAVLWKLAVRHTQDPCFSLRLTKYFQPNTYSAVGLAMASSSNVLEGLKRCLRFTQMTTDAAVLSMEQTDTQAILHLDIPTAHEPVAYEAVEAFSATMISLFRLMTNDNFAPVSVSYTHRKPMGGEEFSQFFKCDVLFDQPRNTLVFNLEDILVPQMLANPSLVNTLETWIVEHMKRFSVDLISTQVKAYLLENILLEEVDLEQIAGHLNLGLRTLQRKLKAEGKSFNEILDECRHDLALKLLSEQRLPLIEISYMLGFADQSGFTRAFKRWTNQSPKSYRDSQAPKVI